MGFGEYAERLLTQGLISASEVEGHRMEMSHDVEVCPGW